MRVFRIALVAALAWPAAGSPAAPVPKQPPMPTHESELAKLQGEWSVTSWTDLVTGQDHMVTLTPDQRAAVTAVFKGDQYTFRINGNSTRSTVRLAPAEKPAAITETQKAGPSVGPNDVVTQGIYKLEGDTLTIAITGAGEARPKSFDAENSPVGVSVFVLKRVKPAR